MRRTMTADTETSIALLSIHHRAQAASWDRPRRVIAKVEHHLGELFPRVGFIVTTLTGVNRAVVPTSGR